MAMFLKLFTQRDEWLDVTARSNDLDHNVQTQREFTLSFRSLDQGL
jgi:hypothetical protein